MYLMYVDESGDTGLANSPSQYFVLSGLVVHETDWRPFMDHLVALRRTLKSVYNLSQRTEVHASEFIRKPVGNIAKHDRLAILRNCIDELTKFPNLSITNVVIDKRNKPLNYDVFNYAWGTLFQRFENTLHFGNFPGGHRNDYGMVITDATSGQMLSKLVRKMSVYNYVPYGNGQTRNIPIKKIIEDPYGKDSKVSLPVQMADVCAYFLHQSLQPNGYVKRKSAQNYFQRLTPVLNLRASNTHALGVVMI